MNPIATGVLSQISQAFGIYSGPAQFKFPETGWWFEWEGKDISDALYDLDPSDIGYDDISPDPGPSTFMPAWATDEGLLWLIPGIIRVVFEVDPQQGDGLLQRLFTELERRITGGELILTREQKVALLEAHETFYCTEEFGWNPENHMHTFCQTIRESI